MATPSPAHMPVLSPRAKRVLIAVVALIVLVIAWYQFVGFYVDFAWFREIKQTEVFTVQLVTRILLFLIAGAGAALIVWFALFAAYRSRPVFLPSNEVDPLSPYRVIVTARPKLFSFGIAGIIGLICGASAQGSWQTVQLWLHGGNFGTADPEFGHDVGFYMFRLPMIQLIISWLFTATVLAFVAVLVTQYVFGGIRFSAGAHRKVTSQAALQLSLLVGVFVLIKAVQYWFDRYDLLFSDRSGIFTGASYTDVHAVLAAKIILMCIAAICAIGFIIGGVLKSVRLPVIALILLVLSSAVIGGIWPLILQKVVVEPSAITREAPFIQRNIAATREAYAIGSDNVEYVSYNADKSGVNPAQLAAEEPGTVKNARLLDPNLLSDTFTQREQLRNFYGFANQLSVDRYTIDNKEQDYIVAAREIDVANFQEGQQGWINQHLVYTHGDGFVAAPANELVDGYPVFQVSDVSNSKGFQPIAQPRIYYGSLAPNYAVVGAPQGTSPREYDTDTTQYTYQGAGGVPVGSFIDRLIFATQYGEANFLFSSEINSESKILYNRDPRERVEKAAPFLTVDTHPYPAIVDGRIVWIVDGYTTAKNYPYAQTVTLSDATTNSQQTGANATVQTNTQISYIRNSVKAVVDAYDGTVTLYQVQNNDPVLNAWEKVFPGLVKPESAVSPDLKAHFRYPEDLFEIQRGLIGKYYVSSPTEFYQGSNFWKVPNDPTESAVTAAQPPYYLEIALPGSQKPQFMLTSAMTWFQREYISAYITANGDPNDYGKITVQQLPVETQTPGPVLIQQLFNSNTDISNYVTTRNTPGRSQILTGNLLTLPTDKGLLYVEPLYLQGVSSSSYPQLGQVLVWYNGQVGMGPSLAAALDNASPADLSEVNGAPSSSSTPPSSSTSTSPPTSTQSGGVSPPPGVTGSTQPSSPGGPLPDAAQALANMQQAEKALSQAKQSGDLGAIGAATEKLYAAVQTYLEVAGPTATTTPGGATSSTSSGG